MEELCLALITKSKALLTHHLASRGQGRLHVASTGFEIKAGLRDTLPGDGQVLLEHSHPQAWLHSMHKLESLTTTS
jgi:hypothetical protein